MQPYQIILLIVVILLFVYIAALVYSFSSCIDFKSRLRKKNKAIALIYAEKKEALLSLYALFVKEDVSFEDEDDEAISSLEDYEFSGKSPAELIEGAKKLQKAQGRLSFIAQSNRWAIKNKEYENYKETMEDLDVNLRQVSASYNADVAAYNYWISIPTCSWLPFIFGHRKVDPLH